MGVVCAVALVLSPAGRRIIGDPQQMMHELLRDGEFLASQNGLSAIDYAISWDARSDPQRLSTARAGDRWLWGKWVYLGPAGSD